MELMKGTISMEKFAINSKRVLSVRDFNIYGHFLEHFHNQIYGGVFDPSSSFADEYGIRKDVVDALRRIRPPVLRWPGGCFVSAYHWQDGVGPDRQPSFDKAWRVEDSNAFGTDEFIRLCRSLDTEPYICTNAGTGTPEEMSDWVEYCNLPSEGKYAKRRIANGHPEPHRVKYWSIGNENYLPGEMGAKTAAEWGYFVRESAKMMKRVDPSIQVLAASVKDIDWNATLLRQAGPFLDWISIHGYWDWLWQNNNLSPYEKCMTYTLEIERDILVVKHILGAFGYLGKIRIAFDEWNLRGWHHPHVNSATEDYVTPRNLNDVNSSYTMADAVFSACFLNQCLRHSDVVGMANFAPTVNTRGAVFAHKDGIVLRSTYFVFDLYVNLMGDEVIDCWNERSDSSFEAQNRDGVTVHVPSLDVVATRKSDTGELAVSIVNRNPEAAVPIELSFAGLGTSGALTAALHTLNGPTKDAYNDIDRPDDVKVTKETLVVADRNSIELLIQPHSVNVLLIAGQS
ncbi:alpha-L-arabinofuranosidase C-terminal domain-containing protein [Paenibacillus sp.]|uniref:alpha-L-arabinofuranosidase C-terminal domain-containing protein n=1 Tax=Paenibacillus sp. TaxID=58172 RepID=UPI002D74F5BD|nr:alpha-L-arabinofuranosidase C-terminal domain-containing protein [Paenibacillus sp.]HZG83385.1 alpha-L-arabinofuranosidase C-terminal domain-containing protein [Paenibacillus sp.]